ncbi:sodium:proton antiporter [Sulfurimonas lithotrophica]|uniref:Sodium:proton antiporter n=2 Tax=Sulfurimonas lithotrophica TaxID=2590022 RepID=A0A5P8P3U5_9BACT|nr:sodium:proton antiporter [Sulfurimonas lithotrophica]
MELIEKSGGIGGFVEYLENKKKLVTSKRSALMLSYIVGVVIFVESSITALISGAVGKPLCDKYEISREKLAYVCDSTSAPISSLIILNGWGALLLGLVLTQIETNALNISAVELLIDSVFYNFYAIFALFVTFISIWYGIDIGPMQYATYKKFDIKENSLHKSMWYMISPIFLMVLLVFLFLYITGDGSIFKGSGSSSIFYTMLSTLLFINIYYFFTKNMSFKNIQIHSLVGAKKLFPIALILLFAFALGEVSSELKTGLYLASLASQNLNPVFLGFIIFLLSSIISFSTGTSWGTFSIMIPIAVPMAIGVDANIALAIGAVISGGVFGDHCSPISDTTIISSLATECDVVSHVKTQLPYALISGVLASVFFIIFSLS